MPSSVIDTAHTALQLPGMFTLPYDLMQYHVETYIKHVHVSSLVQQQTFECWDKRSLAKPQSRTPAAV